MLPDDKICPDFDSLRSSSRAVRLKQYVRLQNKMRSHSWDSIFHFLLEDVSFKLYDDHKEGLVLRGGYLIADGGFLQLGSKIEKIWSELSAF